jgi:hypothetical protein
MSLKIININSIGDDLTVDNTIISVDNDIITVDQTISNPETYILKVPYRFFTTQVKMYLWNEIKEIDTILDLTVVEEDGIMKLEFQHDFEDAESYEVRITDTTDKLIWRGKILSTIQTDLENYILHKVVDNSIIKI